MEKTVIVVVSVVVVVGLVGTSTGGLLGGTATLLQSFNEIGRTISAKIVLLVPVRIPSIRSVKASNRALLTMPVLFKVVGVHVTHARKDLATKANSNCFFIIALSTKTSSSANYYY